MSVNTLKNSIYKAAFTLVYILIVNIFSLIKYRKIPVIVPPVIFIFFILFITRWDFSSSDKNKRKLRRQSCVLYPHF